jgi:Major Facilitator Superfamily
LLVAVALGFTAWSAVATYASVWLATELRLSVGLLVVAFTITGCAGALGSLAGGYLVRRGSPRPVMLVCSLAQAVISLGLFGRREAAGVAIAGLALVTLLQPVRGVAQRSVLVAVVAPPARERAFVWFRTAMNLGVVAGPAVLALLLIGGWAWARVGVVALFLAAAAAALLIPRRSPGEVPGSATAPLALARILSDGRLLGLFAVSTGAWTLVSGVEVVLPAVLTLHHEISTPTWGFAYAVAASAVVVLQTPVGRPLARFSLGPRLCLGAAALGVAFAPPLAITGVVALVCTLALFSAGELLWGPPSEEVVVALAPAGSELDYLAVTGASVWIAESLAAAAGFLTGQYLSPTASWAVFMAIGTITTLSYSLLARGIKGTEVKPEASG